MPDSQTPASPLPIAFWVERQTDGGFAVASYPARLRRDVRTPGDLPVLVNDLQAALKSNPDDPGTLNDLAWILAASPIESFRDGKTAFKLAERLSKIEGETIQSLDALGTAYAAVGNYKMGAERLERALAMAKAEKAKELIGPLTMRMNFFKKGRVYSDETIGSDR